MNKKQPKSKQKNKQKAHKYPINIAQKLPKK